MVPGFSRISRVSRVFPLQNTPPRLWSLLLSLVAWGWCAAAFAQGVECIVYDKCAENDLLFARRHYESGTNCLAQGKFKEAEAQFIAAEGFALERLRQLEQEAEVLDAWKAMSGIIGQAREYFETDWTNAIWEAQALREPLMQVFASIRRNACDVPEMRKAVKEALQQLEWLNDYAETGNRLDAVPEMSRLQQLIDRPIALHAMGGEFRQIMADTARARDQLEEGTSGGAKEEAVATDKQEETRRRDLLVKARYHLEIARQMLERNQPLRARAEVETAELSCLCKLGHHLDEATLAERDALIREVEELDAAAERMLSEGARGEGIAPGGGGQDALGGGAREGGGEGNDETGHGKSSVWLCLVGGMRGGIARENGGRGREKRSEMQGKSRLTRGRGRE